MCRLRQCWYSAAAARAIAEEAPNAAGSEGEEEPLATSTLERRLHTAPAIQFAGDNRRGGFNKVRQMGHEDVKGGIVLNDSRHVSSDFDKFRVDTHLCKFRDTPAVRF